MKGAPKGETGTTQDPYQVWDTIQGGNSSPSQLQEPEVGNLWCGTQKRGLVAQDQGQGLGGCHREEAGSSEESIQSGGGGTEDGIDILSLRTKSSVASCAGPCPSLLNIVLGHFLEKEMAPHSSTLAWKIVWMEEPGRLQSMGSHRVGHNWSDLEAAAAGHFHLWELSVKQNQIHVTVANYLTFLCLLFFF